MKIIDFQEEMKMRKGEILDIQESAKIEEVIKIKEISRENESSNVEAKSSFATIKPGEARNVIFKEMTRKDVSLERKKKAVSFFKRFGRIILSNKKIALVTVIAIVGSLSTKGLYNSFAVHADSDDTYVSKFNKNVEDKYLKELESLSVSTDEISTEQNEVAPVSTVSEASSEKPKTYFNVDNVNAIFVEEVKGKNSTYTVNVAVTIPTSKIVVKVSDVVDIAYSEEDIEIVSVDIKDSFNREYLSSISVDEKTIKDIESLIEKEKESVREKIYSKSKQEFMDVINKTIKDSINL